MARKSKIIPIKLSESTYQIWYDKLVEFFVAKGLSPEEAAKKVKDVLEQAQSGWPHAPRKIEVRIKMKSGYQWKSHQNLLPNAESLPSVINSDDKRKKTVNDMYNWEESLSSSEKDWWDNRESEYREEFEFNKSSDEPLLFQLLVEELTQRRLGALILKDPSQADTYSKLMTESLKRLQETQTKLGITREQRSDALDNKAGDIASLAVDFDEKVRRAKLKIKEWEKDTAKHKFRKDQDGPINILPPISKIEALLGLDPDGNIGDNFFDDSMTEMAAGIHNETLDDLEEFKETKPSIKAHGDETES